MERIDRLTAFLDHVRGGAWPFLSGGMTCALNSINERDLIPLIRFAEQWLWGAFLEGHCVAM